MRKVAIFESERATGYNLFVITWIPNYHNFSDHLPKLSSKTNQKICWQLVAKREMKNNDL
ncbi:MAG: hypothetical protein UZ09_BCD002000467 [Bacteroidetes bacterium OLB9]|nr:MAG: hypothetical protein UZ09_BCD002000467 [Bacteroidetes bacterium OLB9]